MIDMSDPVAVEAYRHECEVRFVCSLPKARRDRYFFGDERTRSLAAMRGQAAADRLYADAKAYWAASRQRAPQLPHGEEPHAGTVASGSPSERTETVPGFGSFLAPPGEGNSDPAGSVDSGVSA